MPIRPFPKNGEFLSKEFFGGPNLSTPFGYLVARIDGGARGNPGPAGYGAVIEDEMGRSVVKLSSYLGKQTNNVAEYSALIAVLKYAAKHGFSAMKVYSDSELMVKQILGEYKVNNPALKQLHAQASKLIDDFEAFEIRHVPREQNREADLLANRAMDLGTAKTMASASATMPVADAVVEVRGTVRNGVVILEGASLPEGTVVAVHPLKR
ncbi:MAG TPA: ribonuclease HI family protein [Candidatus Bathyarchaeia archaeon]|nr:ribonuclease HI family protein [Candidatus Bathyarchaeia archaeon]